MPRPAGLDGAQVQDLAREVPVVERLRGVEALVALQPDELRAGRLGERAGERGLADAGVALEEQRAAQSQRQVAGRGQPVVGQVAGGRQKRGQLRRRGGQGIPASVSCANYAPPPAEPARSRLVSQTDRVKEHFSHEKST